MSGRCLWCRFRIRWYPRYGAWGTYTGTQEFATRCPDNPAGVHEPEPVKEIPDAA